jgi:hypothetical protein
MEEGTQGVTSRSEVQFMRKYGISSRIKQNKLLNIFALQGIRLENSHTFRQIDSWLGTGSLILTDM